METKNYCVYDRIVSARDEKEQHFEELIPEYLPGIERIVHVKAIPVVRYEHIEDKSLHVSVRTVYKVMFVSEYKKQLKCTTFTKDEEFMFGIKDLPDEQGVSTVCDCNAVCSYVRAKADGARRLQVHSAISVTALVYGAVREELPFTGDGMQDVVCLERDIPVISMSDVTDTSGEELRLSRELTLEQAMPEVAEIVDASVSMCVCGVDTQTGNVTGNAMFTALYRTPDDAYVTLGQEIPFTHRIGTLKEYGEAADDGGLCGHGAESAYKVLLTPVSVTAQSSADNYGENRVITIGITASEKVIRYSGECATLCEDAFCRKYACTVSTKPYPSRRLYGTLDEKFELTGSISASGKEIDRIISADSAVYGVSTEYASGKVTVNMKLSVSVLGTSPSGDIVFVDGILPLTAVFTAETDALTDHAVFDTSACVSTIDCVLEAGEIRCTAEVCVRSIVTESLAINGVAKVEADSTSAPVRGAGELVIYYPTKSDTVWSVAKRYRVSPESLKQANGISGDGFDRRTVIIPME